MNSRLVSLGFYLNINFCWILDTGKLLGPNIVLSCALSGDTWRSDRYWFGDQSQAPRRSSACKMPWQKDVQPVWRQLQCGLHWYWGWKWWSSYVHASTIASSTVWIEANKQSRWYWRSGKGAATCVSWFGRFQLPEIAFWEFYIA